MLRNYLKIAWRNLILHKGYTFINVSGLAIGIACCILIALFIRHEWSYDLFHEKKDRIYRVVIQEIAPDGTTSYRSMQPPALADALVKAFPGIERATRYIRGEVTLVRDNQSFREQLTEADSTLFRMFSFPLLAGDPATVLKHPTSMVVSETAAQKYFGVGPGRYEDALGKTLFIKRKDTLHPFTITGVMQDAPGTSSLLLDVVISFENYDTEKILIGGNDWGSRNALYVELAEGQDAQAIEAALPPFTRTEFARRIEGRRNGGFIGPGADAFSLRLQPLRDVHLNPRISDYYHAPTHNPLYSYLLAGIGALVLLIACINFMTLSVGRSAGRAKEVGVRKVFGAYRMQLMRQFWGEAVLLSGLALLAGAVLAVAALPLFNQLTTLTLALDDLREVSTGIILIGLMLTVGLISGSYPAVVLSRFQPVAVLKGPVRTGGKSVLIRALVVAQYALSIALMIGAGLMAQQMDYIQNKDLGYIPENVVAIQTGGVGSPELVERFRNAVAGYDDILNVVSAGYSFTRGGDRISWTDADGTPRGPAWVFGVDYDYLDVMNMELAMGRNFSRDITTDPTGAVLVNEALVREFKLQNPLGYKLTGWASWFMKEPPEIIGVVRDFNFESLHTDIKPAIMTMHPGYHGGIGAILVKIKPARVSETIARLETAWSALAPDTPFMYAFLDDDIARQYQADERWNRIIGYSAALAVFIACLGLFGLVTLAVANRTKEIGIRKVLGASATDMVTLIAKEFVKLVAVAAVIACPLAYYGGRVWLGEFAYRIDIQPWVFIGASLLALLIALATLSYQAVRAALANPVKTLRYE